MNSAKPVVIKFIGNLYSFESETKKKLFAHVDFWLYIIEKNKLQIDHLNCVCGLAPSAQFNT